MSEKAHVPMNEDLGERINDIADREGKYLTFSMAEEEYGIGILKIKEIVGMMPSPRYCKHRRSSRGSSSNDHERTMLHWSKSDLLKRS
jgi:hypothetical protein